MIAARVLAYIGLGSNLDDPAAQLRDALRRLDEIPDSTLRRSSKLYRTPPWGRLDQPEFVNAVAELDTALDAHALLEHLQQIERDSGRARREHWGPRVLDLDLLLHGTQQIADARLQLPHPHLHERAFVLVPLAELVPDLVVPGRGRVADLLAAVDRAGIQALG
jgi:2-amino-4-hydroxy-6-hydroxymethyldihydropteridine diphosphokinase